MTIPGLTEGKDFTVSYANNINPGTATVTISFKGNYTGKVTKTFVIRAVNPDGDENDITSVDGMEKSITGMTNDGDPVGSSFAPLKLLSKKQTKNSVKLSLKAKKKTKIKVTQVKAKGVKKVKKHRKVVFESSDTAIAAVSKKGKVKALKKGKCIIYAYAQNGIFGQVKLTVK